MTLPKKHYHTVYVLVAYLPDHIFLLSTIDEISILNFRVSHFLGFFFSYNFTIFFYPAQLIV